MKMEPKKINTIRGKVIVKETGFGIPNLIIVVYDLDPRTVPEEIFSLCEEGNYSGLWARLQGDRLGSIITDNYGMFELLYEDTDFRVRNCEARPDILLLITAPEEPNTTVCPHILHVSCGVRQNAGRIEHYLVQIPMKQLDKAGVRLPPIMMREFEKPEDILKRLKEKDEQEEQLRKGIREITKTRMARLYERQEAVNKVLPSPVKILSKIPEKVRKMLNYVEPGQSIEDMTFKNIEKTIKERISNRERRISRTSLITLTKEQQISLKDEAGDFREDISTEELRGLVFELQDYKTPLGPVVLFPLTGLIRSNIPSTCQPPKHPDEVCHEENEPPVSVTSEVTDASGTEAPDEGVAPEDNIPRHVANLLNTMTSPEGTVRFEPTGKRADQKDIQKQIDQFELKGGPADTPAFYDFHNLQIAFDHVWREAFNEETFNLLKETYKEIEDLGGNPGAIFAANKCDPPKELGKRGEETLQETIEAPAIEVSQVFEITQEQWMMLSKPERDQLIAIAKEYLELSASKSSSIENFKEQNLIAAAGNRPPIVNIEYYSYLMDKELSSRLDQGKRIIRNAESKQASKEGYVRLHSLLKDLNEQINEPYAFTIYAARRCPEEERSVNFGILVTYRQKWEPLGYQPGELVKTIPLAPKEVRKFSKKVVWKNRRSEKEVANNLRSRREEMSETARTEDEIIRRANTKTNFNLSAEADFNILMVSGKATTKFDKEDAAASEEVKKEFREAVLKSAEEFKQEHSFEINTEETRDVEAEETGEISNPNEEIPVTFLFYELQRRYRISEQIHRVRPVIFVAQEVPQPDEIDEDWLVAHDWILRRVILDDSFLPALTYLATKLVGDEFALEELRKNMELQRDVVEKLKEEITTIREQTGSRYAALERSIERRADLAEKGDEGFLVKSHEFMFGSGSGATEESVRIREEASKDAYERAAKEEKESRARLEREITALNAATEIYTKSLREHLDRKAQALRLRVHIKQNILYYMQAIWSHEPPDQRFFRLHKVKVPKFTGQLKYTVSPANNATNAYPHWNTNPVRVDVECDLNLPLEFTTLAEVADLENLLGYKGNYMIFPLKEGNCLTDFMMTPYMDPALGLRDPDEFGNWTLEEFSKYVCCLKKSMGENRFRDIRDSLRNHYQRLLSAPHRSSEEIVVSTGSLFIEALPGAHPILEDFKLKHRAMDVKKVQSEIRKAELENIRAAARILSAEYEDPDIDKKIVIEGGGANVTVP